MSEGPFLCDLGHIMTPPVKKMHEPGTSFRYNTVHIMSNTIDLDEKSIGMSGLGLGVYLLINLEILRVCVNCYAPV